MAFLAEHQFQSDVRYAGMKSRSVQHRAGDRKIVLVLYRPKRTGQSAHRFRRLIEADGLTQALKVKIYRYLATRGFSAKSIKAAIIAIQQPE